MATSGYTNSGAVNTDVDFDTSNVKGKTAIVTGGILAPWSPNGFQLSTAGANGIGEAYTRALVKAG